MIRYCSLVLLCLICVGCTSVLKRPTSSVAGMTVQSVDAAGFQMKFDVDVQNPNSVELPLATVSYGLSLDGTKILDGQTAAKGTIPAGGSYRLALPISVTYENLLAAQQSIVKSGGNVPYTFNGAIILNTGMPFLGDLQAPVQYSGVLPIRDILHNPQALLSSPAAQTLARQLILGFFNR